MRRICRDDEAAAAVVERVLGVTICRPFAGLLVEDENGPVGAFILNNFDRRDVHVTVVNFGACSIATFREIARRIFVELDCHRVTAVTRADNRRAIVGLEKLGFRSEGRLREHFDGADGLIFGLLRSEQKLIRI